METKTKSKPEKKLTISAKRKLALEFLQDAKSDSQSFCCDAHSRHYFKTGEVFKCCSSLMRKEYNKNKKITDSASEKKLDKIIKEGKEDSCV